MPGIYIGNYINKVSSRSWTQRSWFDFLWNGESTATELVDESGNGNNFTITGKDFTGSVIPGTSFATFKSPNNATFIADDTDNVLFKSDNTQRSVSVHDLNLWDLQRVIVKYSATSPFDIEAFGVLKASVVLTSAVIDKLSKDFQLPLFWSGVENTNGYLKGNRGLIQRLWRVEVGNNIVPDASSSFATDGTGWWSGNTKTWNAATQDMTNAIAGTGSLWIYKNAVVANKIYLVTFKCKSSNIASKMVVDNWGAGVFLSDLTQHTLSAGYQEFVFLCTSLTTNTYMSIRAITQSQTDKELTFDDIKIQEVV